MTETAQTAPEPGAPSPASTPSPSLLPPRRMDYLSTVVMLCLLCLAALLAVRTWSAVSYPFVLDTGEGTALSAAFRASRGGNIYATIDTPPYFFTIYNPVLPYLCGLAYRLFGPSHLAPRLLVVSFYLATALVIFLFVKRETRLASAALIAALFLITGRYLIGLAGSAVTDYTALFFSLLGLYLWQSSPRARYWAVAAFIVAFFTKQTSLTAAAAFSALFLQHRKSESVRLFVLFFAGIALGLLLCYRLFANAYFLNAYQYVSVAPFNLQNLTRRAGAAFFFFALPMAAWLWLLPRSLRDKKYLLPVLYALFALLTGLSSGREGACRLYWCDFSAAMAMIVGSLWVSLADRAKTARLTAPIMAVVALQTAFFIFGTWHGSKLLGGKPHDILRREQAVAVADAFKENSGLILCRYSGVEIGAPAQNATSDIFKLTHLIDAGIVPRSILLDGITQQRFSMVIMPPVEHNWVVFTPDMRQAVEKHYTLQYQAHQNLFFVPAPHLRGDVVLQEGTKWGT